jgi:hypothetical protein
LKNHAFKFDFGSEDCVGGMMKLIIKSSVKNKKERKNSALGESVRISAQCDESHKRIFLILHFTKI